jgi:acetyl-CoA carboxylase biotin carboxyl carrier protein
MATIELKADITGTIWKVLKAVGDAVGEDEAILILESMKMEIPVASPEPGTIAAILAGEGDIVRDGMVLVRIDVKG